MVTAVAAAVTVAVTAAFGEALAPAFAASRGDRWLARWLPAAAVLSSPLHPLAAVFLRLEQFVRNQFDLPRAEHARRIVEDLRDTIEDSEIEGDLGETSREIIENVIELQDVDAAAVMFGQRLFISHHVNRGPLFRTGLCKNQRAIVEVECREAIFR